MEESARRAADAATITIDVTNGSEVVGAAEASVSVAPIAVRDVSTSPGAARYAASNHGNNIRIEMPSGVVIHVADCQSGW